MLSGPKYLRELHNQGVPGNQTLKSWRYKQNPTCEDSVNLLYPLKLQGYVVGYVACQLLEKGQKNTLVQRNGVRRTQPSQNNLAESILEYPVSTVIHMLIKTLNKLIKVVLRVTEAWVHEMD